MNCCLFLNLSQFVILENLSILDMALSGVNKNLVVEAAKLLVIFCFLVVELDLASTLFHIDEA